MKKPPRKYKIDTFEKLINAATHENIERLSIDFMMWLYYVIEFAEQHRKDFPEETKGRSTADIMNPSFNWVDDGLHKITHFELINPLNGEVFNYPLKKPFEVAIKKSKRTKSKP